MAKKDCDTVLAALREADNHTPDQRDMFIGAFPLAVALPPLERHPFQQQVIDFTVDALRNELDNCSKKEEEIIARIHEEQKELDAIKVRAVESTSTRTAAIDGLVSKEAAFAESKAELAKVTSMHKTAMNADQQVEKRLAKAQQMRDRVNSLVEAQLDMVLNGSFRSEDGGDDTEGIETAVQEVIAYLKELNAEEALIAALPFALQCPETERQEFDKQVIESTRELFRCKQQELNAQVQAYETEHLDASTETLGLWAMLDEATEKSKIAEQEVESSKADLKKAEANEKAAQKDVVAQERKIQNSHAEQGAHETLKQKFVKALDAVNSLTEWPYNKVAAETPIVASTDVDMGITDVNNAAVTA